MDTHSLLNLDNLEHLCWQKYTYICVHPVVCSVSYECQWWWWSVVPVTAAGSCCQARGEKFSRNEPSEPGAGAGAWNLHLTCSIWTGHLATAYHHIPHHQSLYYGSIFSRIFICQFWYHEGIIQGVRQTSIFSSFQEITPLLRTFKTCLKSLVN